MNKKTAWFAAGFSIGAAALVLAQRSTAIKKEIDAWQELRRPALDVHACPTCRGELTVAGLRQGWGYHCPNCRRDYPVEGGIAHFIDPEALTGMNRTFSRLYDWFSLVYRAFSKIAFAYIGISEEQARREITDRLDPRGGRVLEVSIGPGVNLPYLTGREDVGEIYGLDISPGQLRRCRQFAVRRGWGVRLDLGDAEALPYADNSFAGVFHIGGINFFNDKGKAIREMVRVAKPGARILIADETEKGAQGFERVLPGFKRSFEGERDPVVPPVDLVPPEMLETRLFDIWKGWLYCIEFRKP